MIRERTAAEPMLDLSLAMLPTVRGSAVLQTSVMVPLVGVTFASAQLFQYAWGRSPLRAGVAQLPMILAMLATMPLVDLVIDRLGARWALRVAFGVLAAIVTVMAIAGVRTLPPRLARVKQ
ncbi:hypothetical protein CGZ93_01390 [Enemella dayhoffiae]|uniref:MFS transporter n=1 Tax=Enemella dayhoffiae TaxID=2016507 RepID=A0A255HBR6_9ACTN|nr:hypothetical protein [Enemella dayhoffiae]OYO25139.1 hypothetical protein CGZ93_01390 [Enemella dayhoffiae]